MLTVEVSWDGSTWTDVTGDVRSLRFAHGAPPKGNPDRPTPSPASGALVLAGHTDQTPDNRYASRALYGGISLWAGLIQDPQILAGELTEPRTRWALASSSADALQVLVEASVAAGTTRELFASDALGALGDIDASDAALRDLTAFDFAGSTGQLLSQAALAASAELVERSDGSIAAVSPFIDSLPSNIRTVTAARMIMAKSRWASNRVRNTVVVAVAGRHSQDSDHRRAWSQAEQVTVNVPVSGPSGATHTHWEAEIVGNVTSRRIEIDYNDRSSQAAYNTGWRPPQDVHGDHTVTGFAVAAGAESGGSVPITITVPAPPQYEYSYVVGRAVSQSFGGFRIGYAWSVISTTTRTSSSWGAWNLTVRLSSRVSGGDAGSQTVSVSNDASVSRWGQRTLTLPEWFLPATEADADAAIQAQLAYLSTVRQEHIVTIRADDQANGADAGDFIILRAQGHNVDIDAVCLVTRRAIAWTPGRDSPWLTLTCLDTGHAPPTPPEPAPGRPRGLTATAQSSTAIDVFWSAPNTGGDVDGYTVRYRPASSTSDDDWTEISRTPAQRSVEISGLTHSTSYRFEVRADGPDASSAWVGVTEATDGIAPGPPTNVRLTHGDGSLFLQWDAPATGGAATHYDVRIDGGNWDGQSGQIRGHQWSNLTNGVQHTVEVRARNQWGTSAAVSRTGTPNPPIPPGAPTGLALTTPNYQTVAATWAAPAAVGDGLDGYDVQLRPASDADWDDATEISPTARNARFTGLDEKTKYDVRVRSRGPGGNSAWTAAKSITTPAEPGVPTVTNLTQNTRFAGYIQWRWGRAPAFAGHTFSRFEWNWKVGNRAWKTQETTTQQVSNYKNYQNEGSGAITMRIRIRYRVNGTSPAQFVHSDYVTITYQPTTFFSSPAPWLALADEDQQIDLPLVIDPLGRPMETP